MPTSIKPSSSEPKRLTLSFDNGPHPDVTPHVLDILKARGIKSTFFTMGRQLADGDNVALAKRASSEGHWLGNHTYTHRPALGERDEPGVADKEIGATQRLLGDLARPEKFFRPSGGGGNLDKRLLNAECFTYLKQHSYTCVLWNSVPGDLQGLDWVAKGLASIEAQPWTLMVIHDVPGGVLPRLEEFLDALEERGGVEIVQEFPESCIPMKAGQVILPMENYIRDGAV